MKVQAHAVISAALGVLVGASLRSPAAGAACFLAGVLVDGDHLLDYACNYGSPFRLRHFFEAFELEAMTRIIVALHAWEWLAAAWILVACAGWPPVGLGLAVGFGAHLALDQVFNRHAPCAYSLAYRVRHRFDARYFYGPREYRARRRYARACGRRNAAGVPARPAAR